MALTELEKLLITLLKGMKIPEDDILGIMLFADQPAIQKELVKSIAKKRDITTSELLGIIMDMRPQTSSETPLTPEL